MGTRGALGFKSDNKYYVSYNHFDSYTDGLGKDVVNFARSISDINKLKKRLSKVKMVKQSEKPTKKDIEDSKGFANLGVGNQSLTDWYCLLRNVQGVNTLELIRDGKLKVMIDGFDFLKDSLFCEYAYIINLDDSKIEFYQGFNQKPQKNNPLPFEQKPDKETRPSGDKYYPVRFVGSCNINKIPKNWDKKFYPEG